MMLNTDTRRLAVGREVLNRVEKPARYIGGEIGSIQKDPGKVKIRFAMCFPDVYEIGMSHLGIQILYDMFNKREDTWCERVYSPWIDMDRELRAAGIPLFALESQTPIRDFDFLGITLQYEMCYTNILQILELSGISLLARDRKEDDPIVMGGGPCTYNPEPLADFFDMFYIGEGEISYDALLDLYLACRQEGAPRQEFLRRASAIPGIYVPSMYEPDYHEDGTLASFTPRYPDVPRTVKKVIVSDLDHTYYPDAQVVPYIRATQDRVVLEIMRGCIRGCRFCQAGMVYRPLRERSAEYLKKQASVMLDNSGYDEISLSSLSSSDYTALPELINHLIDDCSRRRINISLPSLRIDAFSLDVMSKVQDVRKNSLTFAPEAGTQRLRNVINKGLTEQDILEGAAQAFHGGWNKVKLYFMLGLPTETEEDMLGIPELCEKIAKRYYEELPKDKRSGKIQITASSSFFVPKPFTPFQWAVMLHKEDYLARAYKVKDHFRKQINQKAMHYQYHEADVTVLEGVLARGDRRVGEAILRAYRSGCLFDAWSEFFDDNKWQQAFADAGLDIDFYNTRERSADELFPWDFIDIGVTKKFLRSEWERAMREQITPNCREACSGCGAASFGCGICHEPRNKKGED